MTLTVLRHPSRPITKRWKADGSIESYAETKNYLVERIPVSDVHELSAALSRIEGQPNAAVIRGTPNGFVDPEASVGMVRKISASFDDLPQPWMMVDVDGVEGSIEDFVAGHLPPAFHDVSFHWQLSSSAGHPKNAGLLKAHLWFYLKTPATSAQLKALGIGDVSIYNPVSFHYTAAPLFDPGVVDPVPVRSGFVQGLFDDAVELETGPARAAERVADDFADLLAETPLGVGRDEIADTLAALPGDLDYETWVKVGMAVHAETRGEGFALWLEWSRRSPKFTTEDHAAERWKSFGKYRGGQVGFAWLRKFASDCAKRGRYAAVDHWKTEIGGAASEFDLREKVCLDIMKDARLGGIERESLAQVVQSAFKGLGTKLPIAAVRGLVAPVKRAAPGAGSWCDGWVWVTAEDKFFRVDSGEWLTKTSFDAKFNRQMQRDPASGVVLRSASDVALEDVGVDVVTRAHYLPWAPMRFVHQGSECVNSYRPSSVPACSNEVCDAVYVVQRHIAALCGHRHGVIEQITAWIAHNVQQPGKKIRWAPVIQGVQGDGKSRVGDMLAAVMGRTNVKTVSPKVIGTDFNGWGEGACVVVFEELKLSGHNRFDVMNAIKPNITNETVSVHRKGMDAYDTDNVTNFLAVTNYRDALPLDDDDRRFYVIFTPWSDLAGMSDVLGMSTRQHFIELTEAIYKHPGVIRQWFLSYKIPGWFEINEAPPMTDEKRQMIAFNVSDEESDLRDLLEAGTFGVTETVLSATSLVAELAFSDINGGSQKLSRLLTKLGWAKVEKKLKWKGASHRIWVKKIGVKTDPTVLRKILDESLQEKAG